MLKTCMILGSFGILLVAGLPAPQDDDEYADDEVCLTTKDSPASEKECVFPFTFNTFTYNGCPIDPLDETKTKRWCSTKVDETGNHITDNWGYCIKGCNPDIFPDELELGSEAGEAASDVCDWTACNGFTLTANVFGKEETYGQCQFPAGNEESEGDDFFCFVNADSNCPDKTLYRDRRNDEEDQQFVSSKACKDPRAPLPRSFGFNFSPIRWPWSSSWSSFGNNRNTFGNNGGFGGNVGVSNIPGFDDSTFTCPEGYPIPINLVCDGFNHCFDGADEQKCTNKQKPHFCPEGYQIPVELICDGTSQCSDGSDEAGCSKKVSPPIKPVFDRPVNPISTRGDTLSPAAVNPISTRGDTISPPSIKPGRPLMASHEGQHHQAFGLNHDNIFDMNNFDIPGGIGSSQTQSFGNSQSSSTSTSIVNGKKVSTVKSKVNGIETVKIYENDILVSHTENGQKQPIKDSRG